MRFVLLAIVALLFAQLGSSSTCLDVSASISESKSACGGFIPCPYGTYCDQTATCSPVKTTGACLSNSECDIAYSCIGPVGAKQCVKNAGVGEACVSDSTIGTPICASALTCSNSTCIGGRLGDGCTVNEQCASSVCTGGKCDLQAKGKSCFSDSQCRYDETCKFTSFPPTCVDKLATGANCTSSNECISGYCTGSSPTAQEVCTDAATLDAGSYCGATSNGGACKSGLCFSAYCAADAPDVCGDDNECPSGQTCNCGGNPRLAGFGKCGTRLCDKEFTAMETCMAGCSDFDLSYTNSCFSLSCPNFISSLSKTCLLFFSFVA